MWLEVIQLIYNGKKLPDYDYFAEFEAEFGKDFKNGSTKPGFQFSYCRTDKLVVHLFPSRSCKEIETGNVVSVYVNDKMKTIKKYLFEKLQLLYNKNNYNEDSMPNLMEMKLECCTFVYI